MFSENQRFFDVFPDIDGEHWPEMDIVCTPSRLVHRGGGGVEPPTKFSKRGGLTGSQLLQEGSWERGVTFFRGVAIFT